MRLPNTVPIPAPDPATPTVAAPAPMNLAAVSMSLDTALVWKLRATLTIEDSLTGSRACCRDITTIIQSPQTPMMCIPLPYYLFVLKHFNIIQYNQSLKVNFSATGQSFSPSNRQTDRNLPHKSTELSIQTECRLYLH